MISYYAILLAVCISTFTTPHDILFESYGVSSDPAWGLNIKEIENGGAPYFFIVVPTYNNQELCIANIESVLKQTNKNWCLHIVDDCSSDGTFDVLRNYIAGLSSELQKKITLRRNIHRHKALYNLWFSITHYARPEWIVVTLDGDDEFAHEKVLDRLAQEYQNPEVWLTHGQYINHPRGTIGNNDKVPDVIAQTNRFREYHWVTSHVRTFKAWLFHRIKLEDLMLDGLFYPMAWDLALMFPMLEQASRTGSDGLPHFRFIPDILYIYKETPINDWKVDYTLIARLDGLIRSRPRYQPLLQAPLIDVTLVSAQADLVIFSFDRPLQLEALLRSIKELVRGLSGITVIYRTSNDDFEGGYDKLKSMFPHVIFVRQSQTHPHADFKPLTLNIVFGSSSPYIMFAVDDNIVKDPVDIAECIVALEKTRAYGFYLKMGSHVSQCYTLNSYQGIPPLVPLTADMYAWQFSTGTYDWRYPNTVDMALYRKSDLCASFAALSFRSPNTLEGSWASGACPDLRKIGLCYEQSKVINLPLNKVQHDFSARNLAWLTPQQMLEKFNQGLRFDIRSFLGLRNNAVHMELIPNLIPEGAC